ncbi:ABC transporter ATP-binding protein [Simplicispira suum]|uniref:Copper ABC transporter ATP-binding protein n=1 Tax=Simplicispira suum TaxID=2109915 RepID=A0A2S0MYW4_9BURK|nr:ABC transporter ATP-binding protein [Simplicispira suum]AVO41080.1 copper ABC transporter ATP-binding protein [Simplicispira suum]MBW7833624.1 ABC transporter ATP-binding protein [Simplicispira suum]
MASTSPVDASAAVSLRGVTKHYGAVRAVDGVDLDIVRGEIFGLIGHNGAGKSTLFKMMLGLEATTAGSIVLGGAPVRGRGFRAARRHIGYLPENVVLYDNLSGLETLHFFARLKHAPLEQCPGLLERVGLAHAGKRAVREYSKGMRQRLGFAQALLGTPQVLFLDEPTNGLDPQAIRDFYATLRTLQAGGVTVVITSHILAELQERVDRLAIMANGLIQALGSVQTLREQTHMPLVFDLILDAGDFAPIAQALQDATGESAEAVPGGLRLACPRTHKMAVLAALAPFGGRVHDLALREPSLEDVFFGFSD